MSEHANLKDATLVIDGHLAYLVSDRVEREQRFLLDVITDLCTTGAIDRQVAVGIVEAIQSRYPPAFVEHTLLLLKR